MINLKQDTEVTEASHNSYAMKVYNDWDGPLWIVATCYGPYMLIRARSFESAWEIMLDESKPIEVEEVPEAYGFYGETAAADLEAAVNQGKELSLVEGYEYQPNSSGTGIVSVDHYTSIRELTTADLRDRYKISIRRI